MHFQLSTCVWKHLDSRSIEVLEGLLCDQGRGSRIMLSQDALHFQLDLSILVVNNTADATLDIGRLLQVLSLFVCQNVGHRHLDELAVYLCILRL
jgi:hypothetical protein